MTYPTSISNRLRYGLSLIAVTWILGGCTSLAPAVATVASATIQPESPTPVQPPSPNEAALTSPVKTAPLAQTATTAIPVATVKQEPPADIWERIRTGFAMPNLEGNLVQDREQWYASKPDYILRMTERSRKYLFYIVEELETRRMPTELALLPFIESAFNPQAVSTAKAAGMWQFMPATGKYFELKQNIFRDDRRSIQESTRAALDYLQKLYGMFGDWHLALAAYNWGEGSVSRALAKNKAAGLGLSYNDLNMPNETRYYVPKLQAVKNIIDQPVKFGARLPLIQNHPYFQSVKITRDIDVNLAARLAEISAEDFKALNPSMSRPVILAAGTPEILLPWDNADIFQRNLDVHPHNRLASWTAWVSPQTMKTSEAAKRVGMTEDQLRSMNNIPQKMLIQAGSTLLVPRKGAMDADVAEHLADNAQAAFSPEVVLKRIILKARKGDTLAGFASKNGVSVANLASWNKLSVNAPLKAGQSIALLIPTTQGRYLAKGLQNKPAPAHAVYSASKANPHTVRSASAAPQLHKRHTPSVKVAKK
jgi:membrane-bound lytic murein transglycosylase D